MIVRKTTMRDFNDVCDIYAQARVFMRESGNPDQWKDTYPPGEIIERDISNGKSYVCICDDITAAVFYFSIECDPTYEVIKGQWLNDEPYGVVHRIAKAREAGGVGAFCLNWCFEQCGNVRVDTHNDNAPMKRLLDKLGFTYCGIILLANGNERLAFQKTKY